ncbi:MAG: spore coat protein, partial [Ruminococcus sp.]|nr:spore coat protein [Ruminococcus sp.]
LNDTLKMQDEIYKKMEAKGWYKTEQAQQSKLDTLKQKFSAQG